MRERMNRLVLLGAVAMMACNDPAGTSTSPPTSPHWDDSGSGGGPGTPGSGGTGATVEETGGRPPIDQMPSSMGDERLLRIENNTTSERSKEVIEVDVASLQASHPELFLDGVSLGPVTAKRTTGEILTTQTLDIDGVEGPEKLLVRLDLAPLEVAFVDFVAEAPPSAPPAVFGRFVPERLDDFAWENELTVYRAYGPALETSGQTSSSGIDVWVKNTSDLVIDDWYALDDYHIDHGQGLDAYQVGTTRGAGGTALRYGSTIATGGVYSSWEVLASGPIRLVFELTYEDVSVGTGYARELKRFTLDSGSRFTEISSSFAGASELAQARVLAGVVVHEGAQTHQNEELRAIRVWEPLDGDNGFVGVALVADTPATLSQEEGHLFLSSDWRSETPLTYYLASAWSKASVSDASAFDRIVAEFVARKSAPLAVSWTSVANE